MKMIRWYHRVVSVLKSFFLGETKVVDKVQAPPELKLVDLPIELRHNKNRDYEKRLHHKQRFKPREAKIKYLMKQGKYEGEQK